MRRFRCVLIAVVVAFECQTAAANDVLPDGTVFRSWEQPPRYTHTYHVAQGDSQASDENPGTAARPWRTIGKAAATLQPGERVIVHRGVVPGVGPA